MTGPLASHSNGCVSVRGGEVPQPPPSAGVVAHMLFLGGDIQCCFYYFERFSRREMRKGKLMNLDVVPKEILIGDFDGLHL